MNKPQLTINCTIYQKIDIYVDTSKIMFHRQNMAEHCNLLLSGKPSPPPVLSISRVFVAKDCAVLISCNETAHNGTGLVGCYGYWLVNKNFNLIYTSQDFSTKMLETNFSKILLVSFKFSYQYLMSNSTHTEKCKGHLKGSNVTIICVIILSCSLILITVWKLRPSNRIAPQ